MLAVKDDNSPPPVNSLSLSPMRSNNPKHYRSLEYVHCSSEEGHDAVYIDCIVVSCTVPFSYCKKCVEAYLSMTA